MDSKKTYKILTLLLVMQWSFIQIIAQYPSFIEKYYSNGFYVYVSSFLRFIFGWIPFSLGDILYAFLIIFIIKGLFRTLKKRKLNLKNTVFRILGTASIIFFVFHFNWALNYFREPLDESLGIEKENYTNEELFGFTKKLIEKTNEIQFLLTKNDTVLVEDESTKGQILKNAHFAYDQLENKYPQFSYKNPTVKNSLFSVPLTYMGFAGYLNPISNEAQVNYLIPINGFPATVCHEIAHQVGYASESEANFIGYLASINYQNTYFNYSGYLMSLRYCLAEVFRKDPEQFELLKPLINKGILKDLKQSQEFWESYSNWSEKYFKFFYDHYLKANKQKDGIEGYSKMVVLLINYYKTEKL